MYVLRRLGAGLNVYAYFSQPACNAAWWNLMKYADASSWDSAGTARSILAPVADNNRAIQQELTELVQEQNDEDA